MTSTLPSPVRKLTTLVALLLAAGCASKKDKAPTISTQAVQRRDIVIDAQATGVVEPINIVEVKSKASGQIVKMPVETGTLVKPGDLLVQIETRDTQNQYDQSAAALAAARSKLEVSSAQKKRSDELFKSRARANAVASQLYSTRMTIKFTWGSARYYGVSKASMLQRICAGLGVAAVSLLQGCGGGSSNWLEGTEPPPGG